MYGIFKRKAKSAEFTFLCGKWSEGRIRLEAEIFSTSDHMAT